MKSFLRSPVQFIALVALALTLRAADKPVRVACVGDSITFGAGVEQREKNNYPKVLGDLLGDKYEVRNFGRSGATLLKKGDLPYWKTPEFKNATEFAPDIVVIKLGTNDSKPQNWAHKEDFAADARALVEHFQALPCKPRVFVCLPVPVYQDKWGINEPIVKGEVIPTLQKVAKEMSLPTIDLYTALSGKAEMFPDKIHPNAAGAKVLAEAVAKALAAK
ncbi:MAG: hypothetical protein HY300_17805 [Verrucomicrobia bacterium]|nr:hypothetical protein [Verrucomicrobiota bacterium]